MSASDQGMSIKKAPVLSTSKRTAWAGSIGASVDAGREVTGDAPQLRNTHPKPLGVIEA
jgi:hypothetical protein